MVSRSIFSLSIFNACRTEMVPSTTLEANPQVFCRVDLSQILVAASERMKEPMRRWFCLYLVPSHRLELKLSTNKQAGRSVAPSFSIWKPLWVNLRSVGSFGVCVCVFVWKKNRSHYNFSSLRQIRTNAFPILWCTFHVCGCLVLCVRLSFRRFVLSFAMSTSSRVQACRSCFFFFPRLFNKYFVRSLCTWNEV